MHQPIHSVEKTSLMLCITFAELNSVWIGKVIDRNLFCIGFCFHGGGKNKTSVLLERVWGARNPTRGKEEAAQRPKLHQGGLWRDGCR